MRFRALFLSIFLVSSLSACSSDPEGAAAPSVAPPAKEVEQGALPAEPPPAPPVQPPADDPGPPPAGCTVKKDADGFFVRSSPKGEYVGYVPKAYTGKPMRLLVGLHGCGDDARNFAEWGVNPYETRDDQEHIGISVDGASGSDNCWSQSDADKVLAAIDDVAKCFYVHKQKVVIAGFSSGGILAYGVGLKNASRFAGILIESSALPGNVDLSKAAWKLPVAHVAHRDDEVFPLAKVRDGWKRLKDAGFSVQTTEVDGGHDGTSEDWAGWLIPKMAGWTVP